MNIGKNIENRRKELGWTQEELAHKMCYKNKTSITKIEAGINDIPQSKIEQFAEVMGISIHDLMGWYEGDLDDWRKNKPTGEESGELSVEEREMLEIWRLLPEDFRIHVLDMLRSAAKFIKKTPQCTAMEYRFQ